MSTINKMPVTVFNIEPEKHEQFFSEVTKNQIISRANNNDMFLFNLHKKLTKLKKELEELLKIPNSAEKQRQVNLKKRELTQLDSNYTQYIHKFISEYNDNGAKLRYNAELENVTRTLNDPNSTEDQKIRAELEFNKASANYYQQKQMQEILEKVSKALTECSNEIISHSKQQRQIRGSSRGRSTSDVRKEIQMREAYDARRDAIKAQDRLYDMMYAPRKSSF